MFLGLLAAPDLFADDRVLLSYLAITDDIGRIFFFSFLSFSFSLPNGRKFIAMNILDMDVFCFFASKVIRYFFFFFN